MTPGDPRHDDPAEGPPAVDVVVLTWNDGDILVEAVRSALDSVDVDVSVIVVDNGSDPPAQTADDPRVTLIRKEVNLGVAAGRNVGVGAGSAEFVCLLDSDARLEPDCLAALVAPLREDAAIALAVPVFVDQRPEASAGPAPTTLTKLSRGLNLRDTYRPVAHDGDRWDVDFGIGACQVFRRVAFEAVDGLDESYFYGPEDVDFCLRLRSKGWRIVQVAAAACHHPPRRRFRRVLTRRGLQHAAAIAAHQWRHRGFARRVAH